MATIMAVRGRFSESFEPVIGRVALTSEVDRPEDTVLLARGASTVSGNFECYLAVLREPTAKVTGALRIGVFDDLGHLEAGDIVLVDGLSGRIRTLYRKSSPHNALFTTDRCNSNCLMCSQPPKIGEDRLATCLRVIDLVKSEPPQHLGITGGEPTLLGPGFIQLVEALKRDLPETTVTALSNGRAFADANLVRSVAAVSHPHLRFTIPLHADVSDIHDYIAQAVGAFRETVSGLYNLAAAGVETEIRVVLHALSVPRLLPLAEFIYRKMPFVQQVAFMGLEHMGYVRKNWHMLGIDPADYADDLRLAVSHLHQRGMGVSIYNLPLCVLPAELWAFARQSISDHKQTLIEACSKCDAASHCAGFFTSGVEHYSRRIGAIRLERPGRIDSEVCRASRPSSS